MGRVERWVVCGCVLVGAWVAGCSGPERPSGPVGPVGPPGGEAEEIAWTELAPGLRMNAELGVLEFDGTVPIDCHNPTTPDVYLELVACTPDTREHESLVVTEVAPSLIHAGLLALGLEPGAPARVLGPGGQGRVAPTGAGLEIELIPAGASRGMSPAEWITDDVTRARRPGGGWVFAGSRLAEFRGKTVYDADLAGTVIGLASFGGETIAYTEVISPAASIDAPVWIADPAHVPVRGTAVRVRLRPAGAGPGPGSGRGSVPLNGGSSGADPAGAGAS